jgi:hypothetical protein
MAAEARADVHHGAPRCMLGAFDAAATGLADWSEFDAEAERLSIEVRGLSRQISTTEHRRLHQEEGDVVRWGRRGGRRGPWPSTAVLLAARAFEVGAHRRRSLDRASCQEFKGGRSLRAALACIMMVSAYTIGAGGGW